jgi:hypothetical protein
MVDDGCPGVLAAQAIMIITAIATDTLRRVLNSFIRILPSIATGGFERIAPRK